MTEPATSSTPRRSLLLERAATQLDELARDWPRAQSSLELGTARRWSEREQDLDEAGNRVPVPVAERCPDCRALRRRTPGYEQRDDDGQVLHVFPGRPYCPNGCDGGGRPLGGSSTATAPVTPGAPGYTRAPLNVGALDQLTGVGAAVVELEDNVRDALGFHQAERHVLVELHRDLPGGWHPPIVDPRPPQLVVPARLVQPSNAGPTPQLLATRDPVDAIGWLQRALPALDRDEHADLLTHLMKETGRAARVLRSALGDTEQVAPIKAPCPICDAMSLRAFPERDVVVCVNDGCTCTSEACAYCPKGRRHRWPRDDWDRLALVLGVDPNPCADGSM